MSFSRIYFCRSWSVCSFYFFSADLYISERLSLIHIYKHTTGNTKMIQESLGLIALKYIYQRLQLNGTKTWNFTFLSLGFEISDLMSAPISDQKFSGNSSSVWGYKHVWVRSPLSWNVMSVRLVFSFSYGSSISYKQKCINFPWHFLTVMYISPTFTLLN